MPTPINCEPQVSVYCDNLCELETLTNTSTALALPVQPTDTEIILLPDAYVPCIGFGIFSGCTKQTTCQKAVTSNCGCKQVSACSCQQKQVFIQGGVEIFFWGGVEILPDGRIRLYNLVRGLSNVPSLSSTCGEGEVTFSGYAENIKSHSTQEMLRIGDPTISYYDFVRCCCYNYRLTQLEVA